MKDLYTPYVSPIRERCYFCDRQSTTRMFIPSLNSVKERGAHGEMVVYDVCQKCYSKVYSQPMPDHESRVANVHRLILRAKTPSIFREAHKFSKRDKFLDDYIAERRTKP